MTPLIDCDVLRYEIGAVGEFEDDDGEHTVRSWEFVERTLDEKIESICLAVQATTEPILYLTGDAKLHAKRSKREVLEEFKPNFREAIAISKPYKGTRVNNKPFHFDNITHYLLSKYNVVVSNGLEADDLICIEQYNRPDDTIICTRDKDLRMCRGWHYGWECGRQEEFGPVYYDELGEIELDRSKSSPKIVGGGFLFFCSQLLTGDVVDNIPGLPKCGAVKAASILEGITDKDSALKAVGEAYRASLGDLYHTYLQEQIDLLWMIIEVDENSNPKRYIYERSDDDGPTGGLDVRVP